MNQFRITRKLLLCASLCTSLFMPGAVKAQVQQSKAAADLRAQQQAFVDLRFGMFIHFNIPTFMDQDWADPEASPAIFNPTKLNL